MSVSLIGFQIKVSALSDWLETVKTDRYGTYCFTFYHYLSFCFIQARILISNCWITKFLSTVKMQIIFDHELQVTLPGLRLRMHSTITQLQSWKVQFSMILRVSASISTSAFRLLFHYYFIPCVSGFWLIICERSQMIFFGSLLKQEVFWRQLWE